MAWLYPMHEREKNTTEQRKVVREFISYITGGRPLAEFEATADKFFGIDREAYARETEEMAVRKEALDAKVKRMVEGR